ncbi:hypothetical protein EYF80_022017 [Liparis tanakae]|uniref:Uncharacterized protein n=1 Tax=Liparis tanakae TaxID=230148 RepID=A0A4Z2HQ55_9TELE|nr:hypothetical protein EYF80_022017 [Liparis tanakae]
MEGSALKSPVWRTVCPSGRKNSSMADPGQLAEQTGCMKIKRREELHLWSDLSPHFPERSLRYYSLPPLRPVRGSRPKNTPMSVCFSPEAWPAWVWPFCGDVI